jgi:hypothetical protein
MFYVRLSALLVGLFVLAGGLPGQDKPKKDEPAGKVKGQLPQGWGKLGLSEEQKQKVYKINAKYGEEIAKLDAQIKELKDKMSKERMDVLTADQKKALQEMNKAKSGG